MFIIDKVDILIVEYIIVCLDVIFFVEFIKILENV